MISYAEAMKEFEKTFKLRIDSRMSYLNSWHDAHPIVGNMFLTECQTLLSAAKNKSENLDELLNNIRQSKFAFIKSK